jgi:hypothetical protein
MCSNVRSDLGNTEMYSRGIIKIICKTLLLRQSRERASKVSVIAIAGKFMELL